MDNLTLFSDLERKIRDLQLKLDAVILRLQLFQKQSNKNSLELTTSLNPLDHYIGGLLTGSCMPSPINNNKAQQNQFSQRWHSQPEQKMMQKFKKIDLKENILDSKSFATIKRSIIINSEQIQQMKDRLIEVEKDYARKIMSVQEGFQVVTRLSQLMEMKIEEIIEQKKDKENNKERLKSKSPANKKINKLIQKYQRKSLQKDQFDFLEKYL